MLERRELNITEQDYRFYGPMQQSSPI